MSQSCGFRVKDKISMKRNFVDCFVLMNAALSLNGGKKLTEMGRPSTRDVSSTRVNVSVTVEDIKFIDSKNMELRVHLLLHQQWFDPRLGANIRTRKFAVAGQIWKPKITHVNGVMGACQNNLEDTVFWRGFGSEGHVLLSEKLVLDVFCTSNLKRFPFDTQFCQLKFGTYRFPMEEVKLQWDFKPMESMIDSILDEFKLASVSTNTAIDLRASGNFTVLILEFAFKRLYWHYVICSGFPALLSLSLCYLTLWIQKERIETRYFLNAIFLGVLLYLYYQSACLFHAAASVKALDVFLLVCISFGITSLLETFVIDVFCVSLVDASSRERKSPRRIVWIERFMRITFPVFYLFFVLCYCLVYIG